MLPAAALDQERLFIAERLLSEIERRHGLSHPNREILPTIVDRFLLAYMPPAREGEPAPDVLEFAFAPTLVDALDFLRPSVANDANGRGAAVYIHDLDTGV